MKRIREYVGVWHALVYLISGLLALNANAQELKKDSLQSVLQNSKENREIAGTYCLLGKYWMQKNQDSSVYAYQRALHIAVEHHFTEERHSALHDLGIVYDFHGEIDSAIFYFKEAFSLGEHENNTLWQAKSANSLGVEYYKEGNYGKSMEYYSIALEKAETIKDTNLIVKFNNNIGHIFYYRKDLEKALQHYNVARDFGLLNSDTSLLSGANQNIGLVYIAKEKYKEAIRCFLFSLEVELKQGNYYGMANCYENLAICNKHLGNRKEALTYYNKSMKIYEEMDYKEGVAQTLVNLGELEVLHKNYSEAILYFKRGLDLSILIKSWEGQKYAYLGLSDAYEHAGKPVEGLAMFKLYSQIKDSIYNDHSSKQINELETKYETHKKEKQIELLNKEKQIDEILLRKQAQFILGLIIGIVLAVLILVLIIIGWIQRKKTNKMLEEKNYQISEANEELHQQNEEISAQRDFIEEQKDKLFIAHEGIKDSIHYARRLQSSILPTEEMVQQLLPDSFVYYLPKDVLSGDYYWVHDVEDGVMFTVVDCTGHGVPGAMMSLMGNNGLNKAVIEMGLRSPADVLDFMDQFVKEKVQKQNVEVKDGMDMALCYLKNTGELIYAGANNPLYRVVDGEIEITKADKQAIGGAYKPYNNRTFYVNKGEALFIFSDGFADQFGGPKGKKYGYKRMQSLFMDNLKLAPEELKEAIEIEFVSWKKNEDQVDDVCIIGVRL